MLYDDNIYISIDKFCELKNISRATFFNMKKKKQIPYKFTKRPGQGKRLFLVIKEKDILDWEQIFIDSHNRFCCLSKGRD